MFEKTPRLILLLAFALGSWAATTGSVHAAPTPTPAPDYRQYYSSWSYHPTTRYHYCRYYYRPTTYATTYSYHYVIYYPSRPRFRYYYNPVRRVYWGRYEVDCQGNTVGYSKLKPEDQKPSLDQIDESAFPPATTMPAVPESEDGELMLEPPADLPK